MTTIIYKGIEIKQVNGYYIFNFNGKTFCNTNLRFAKVMLNKELKNYTKN